MNQQFIIIYNGFPQVGSTYSVEVSHPNFESVSAETTVPQEIELSELAILDNSDISAGLMFLL